MAADMRLPAPPPPVVYYDWSGAYIGFNAGGVWYDVDRTFPSQSAVVRALAKPRTSDSDGIFGFHAGAQWQWGAWVLGAEAALSGCFRECRSISGDPSESALLPANQFCRAQDHQPLHGGPAAGLCLGSCDDLCDRWLCFGRSQGTRIARLSAAFADRPASPMKRRLAQQRLVCRRRLRLHGPQGRAGRRAPRPRISTLRRGLEECVLLQPGCYPATRSDYDLGAKGDIVRARLTIKTQGYGFSYR